VNYVIPTHVVPLTNLPDLQFKNAESIENGDITYVFSVKNFKPANYSFCIRHHEFHPHTEFGPQCTQVCTTNPQTAYHYTPYSNGETAPENINPYFPIGTPIYNTQVALHELNNGHAWSNESCHAKVTKRNHVVEEFNG
jgi:hypothetical protein